MTNIPFSSKLSIILLYFLSCTSYNFACENKRIVLSRVPFIFSSQHSTYARPMNLSVGINIIYVRQAWFALLNQYWWCRDVKQSSKIIPTAWKHGCSGFERILLSCLPEYFWGVKCCVAGVCPCDMQNRLVRVKILHYR